MFIKIVPAHINKNHFSGNNNEILNEFLAGKLNNNNSDSQNGGNSVKKRREERLSAAHEEEIGEMQKRIQHWVQRTQQMAAEHQKELQAWCSNQ
jgi:hypothetical protein